MIISQVAENIPDKIEKLVYVSAYLPAHGDDLMSLATTDTESLLGPSLVISEDGKGASLSNENLSKIFAHDVSDENKQKILNHNRIEPLISFQYKVQLSDQNFGMMPKYYIKTKRDRAVGPQLQTKMIENDGSVREVFEIDSGHSPYFAKPQELVEILIELAA
jgi:pimeloyl-ACP methyl ester carboxylesterase